MKDFDTRLDILRALSASFEASIFFPMKQARSLACLPEHSVMPTLDTGLQNLMPYSLGDHRDFITGEAVPLAVDYPAVESSLLRVGFPRCCLMPSEYGEDSRRDGQERLCHLGRYRSPQATREATVMRILQRKGAPLSATRESPGGMEQESSVLHKQGDTNARHECFIKNVCRDEAEV
ncbi:hypothetical protein MG293_011060 [Ovis ammon polii]|uniref:Uncharacterized protein n=1 Tax=Ovis ammon polii TaxID=230172 RepID=A0AAD4U3J2_OVIAM|nr:hypothetical protein MG293_011060 [Ovis ammon polii]KAI4565214.1 hypothetical protein MJT46_009557 [Ovis ammon polii x Ovis aries]